jgi:hypothetical protein
MLKEISNRGFENGKEQLIAEVYSLQEPVMGSSACPERSRGACPRKRKSIRGQQILEYAILIAAISAALTAMFVYGKRGLQSMVRQTADQIGPQKDSEQIMSGALVNITPMRGSSAITTYSSDTMDVQKTGEARSYDTASVSFSSGNSTTITETAIVRQN